MIGVLAATYAAFKLHTRELAESEGRPITDYRFIHHTSQVLGGGWEKFVQVGLPNQDVYALVDFINERGLSVELGPVG